MEDIKTLLKEHTEEVKRHMDVLREDFDGKVRLIAEQYASIEEALGSHTKIMVSIKEGY